jgi:hypothetical protein
MRDAKHASVPLRRVRAGELRVRSFSTNSRPALRAASGRPPARQRHDGRRGTGLTVQASRHRHRGLIDTSFSPGLGPHWGHTRPDHQGQQGSTTVSRRPRSAALSRGRCWSARHPGSLSHGGSQGFKSPHLHPQPCRSERRQRRAGDAHCRLRPRCGRKLKSQCSPKALRGQPTQAQASHNDHAAWSPPAASR